MTRQHDEMTRQHDEMTRQHDEITRRHFEINLTRRRVDSMNWRDEKRTLRHDYAARRDEHFVQELTQYSASPKVLETIFFYGDALTKERARNVPWTFRDGDSEVDRLKDLDPVHTD